MSGRALGALAYAFLRSASLRRFGLSLLDAVLVVVAYALAGQTLMGGEWLFNGFEAKVISYCLVLAGLYMAATGPSFLAPILLFAQATYFHFLFGGFWLFARRARPPAAARPAGPPFLPPPPPSPPRRHPPP